MQNYRIPLSEISPSGKDMTLDDPAIWQGPLAEFQMDCRIIDPLKAAIWCAGASPVPWCCPATVAPKT